MHVYLIARQRPDLRAKPLHLVRDRRFGGNDSKHDPARRLLHHLVAPHPPPLAAGEMAHQPEGIQRAPVGQAEVVDRPPLDGADDREGSPAGALLGTAGDHVAQPVADEGHGAAVKRRGHHFSVLPRSGRRPVGPDDLQHNAVVTDMECAGAGAFPCEQVELGGAVGLQDRRAERTLDPPAGVGCEHFGPGRDEPRLDVPPSAPAVAVRQLGERPGITAEHVGLDRRHGVEHLIGREKIVHHRPPVPQGVERPDSGTAGELRPWSPQLHDAIGQPESLEAVGAESEHPQPPRFIFGAPNGERLARRSAGGGGPEPHRIETFGEEAGAGIQEVTLGGGGERRQIGRAADGGGVDAMPPEELAVVRNPRGCVRHHRPNPRVAIAEDRLAGGAGMPPVECGAVGEKRRRHEAAFSG